MEIDGYEGLERFGGGGFSTVYRAVDPRHDRDVAIKVLNVTQFDADTERRFRRECRSMGKFTSHPNIVSVFDSGVSNGRPYIVMDYYRRGSLRQRLEESALSVSETLALGVQIASALATVHNKGIQHKDIKPDNVLVNDYGQWALTDFGISAITDSSATHTVGGGYTPGYAPPEVERVGGVGATGTASDIYSLGVTLYECIEGKRFVRAGGRAPIVEDANASAGLKSLITSMTEEDPALRPQSAASVASELRRIQEQQGYSPTPVLIAGFVDPRKGATKSSTPARQDWSTPTAANSERQLTDDRENGSPSEASSAARDGLAVELPSGRRPSWIEDPLPAALNDPPKDYDLEAVEVSPKDQRLLPPIDQPAVAQNSAPSVQDGLDAPKAPATSIADGSSRAVPDPEPQLADLLAAEPERRKSAIGIGAVVLLGLFGGVVALSSYLLTGQVDSGPEQTTEDFQESAAGPDLVAAPVAPTDVGFEVGDDGETILRWAHAGGDDIRFLVRSDNGGELADDLREPEFVFDAQPASGDCFYVAAVRVAESRRPLSSFVEACFEV